MDSSVRDLLDGYLRDLLTAYEGFKKAVENHEAEIDPAVVTWLRQSFFDMEEGIGGIACAECWGSDRKPYRVGLVRSKYFENLCEPCAAKGPKPDPFGGVTTFRSDE